MVLLASSYDESKYFKAADIERDRKLRIKTVTEEEVGIGADKERKLVVWFTNDKRGLVLNRVNNRTIRSAFGDDVAGWSGKIVALFPTKVDMRGRMVDALRVRIPPPKQAGNGQAGNGSAQAQPAAAPPAQKPEPAATEIDPELADDPKSIGGEMDDEIPF